MKTSIYRMSKVYRYKSETPLSFSASVFKPQEIEDYVEVDLSDGKAYIYDDYRKIDDEFVRDGLIIDIFLEDWSESEARGWKNLLASVLSFSSKTEVSRPRLVQKIEDKEPKADFEQIYRLNQSIPPEVKKMNMEFFKELNNSLTTIYDKDRDLFRELGRALMYYRKSLGEIRAEDRFTDLYIVLDALMKELKQHYISENNVSSSQDKKYGLRQLFDEFSNYDFDDDIYAARCELFHDGEKQKAVKMVEDLEEAVERGLCKLLDIEYQQYSQILNQGPNRVGKDPALLFKGQLKNYSVPTPEENLDLPQYDIEGFNLEIIPLSNEQGNGIGLDGEIGDFLEFKSDGITDTESWYGTRGAVNPNGSPQNIF